MSRLNFPWKEYLSTGGEKRKSSKVVVVAIFLSRVFVGCLEVQERMVGMVTLVPPVLKAPLGLVEVMETEDSGELRVPKVLQG